MTSDFDKKVYDFFEHYQDRGMVKWQGFYLSDQTKKINQRRKEQAYIEVKKDTMTLEDISQVLMKAYADARTVSVQLSLLNQEGNLQKSFKGHVLGVDGTNVMIDDHIVNIDDINHVEII